MTKAELVEFTTKDKLVLPGLLYEPAGKTKKALISLHGNGSSSAFYNVEQNNSIAKAVNGKGVAFFPFNNRGAHYVKRLRKSNSDEHIMAGTAYELIKDCIYDIDGAINYLKTLGYEEFYLIGFSTGANKICVYNYYKKHNQVSQYILAGGGDDTGIFHEIMGNDKFNSILLKSRQKTKAGKGDELAPYEFMNGIYSYQSILDILDPDGDYNTFPFSEAMGKAKLSVRPLFSYYKHINKPTLVVYGENDEYCYGDVRRCVKILKSVPKHISRFTYEIIKDADHGFHGKNKELAKIVADWLDSV